MNFKHILALLIRDWKIFIATNWKWIEFLYFPISSLIIWGLFAIWTGELANPIGAVALAVNIYWSWAYTVQSTINLSMNEDMWSRSGSQLFAAGISQWEYIAARVCLSTILSIVNLAIMFAIAQALGFFDFIRCAGPALLLASITYIASIGIAFLIGGLLFVFGIEHNWLSWSALQFFIVASSPLAPPAILPPAIQAITAFMPYTDLFQAVRALAIGEPWFGYALSASFVSAGYLAFSILIYHLGFKRAKVTGELGRMF